VRHFLPRTRKFWGCRILRVVDTSMLMELAEGPELARTDAIEWMRTLPEASVDLVVTDPPYESLEKHRAIGTTTRLKHSKASSNDWFTVTDRRRASCFPVSCSGGVWRR
jgi:16S rRNA G966 N2-methylase RsmD